MREISYSGKFSRDEIFCRFYGWPNIRENFICDFFHFSTHLQKFCPAKISCYTVAPINLTSYGLYHSIQHIIHSYNTVLIQFTVQCMQCVIYIRSVQYSICSMYVFYTVFSTVYTVCILYSVQYCIICT